MWRALEEREKTRQEYIEVAARYVDALAEVLSPLTGILYGSVARGDFNFWTCSPANCCRTALFFATIFTFGAGHLGAGTWEEMGMKGVEKRGETFRPQ